MTEQNLVEYLNSGFTCLGGNEVAKLPSSLQGSIADQVIELLKPYIAAGYMVQQTHDGLIEFMQKGLTSVMYTPIGEMLGFAKLYPYPGVNPNSLPEGYEFSTWLARYPHKGIGNQILKDALKAYKDQSNPRADLFAVCSSTNIVPQIKLLAVGGEVMERPPYVPNMLEAQDGMPHQETCINLKPLLIYSK